MDDKQENVLGDYPVEEPSATLEALERLRQQLSGFNGRPEKNIQPLRNPAAVSEIYRNAMKKPAEAAVPQLREKGGLKQDE